MTTLLLLLILVGYPLSVWNLRRQERHDDQHRPPHHQWRSRRRSPGAAFARR